MFENSPLAMLRRLAKKKENVPTKDEVAAFLKTTPEAIAAFEAAYAPYVGSDESSPFAIDAKTAKDEVMADTKPCDEATIERIAQELVAVTDGHALPGDVLGPEELEAIEPSSRPQLTANAMRRDIGAPSWEVLAFNLMKYEQTGDERYYHMFRQGLDILDLDPVTYEMLGCNPNSIGHWIGTLTHACETHGKLRVPETKVVKVPLPILQLSRLDYAGLNASTLAIVNRWAKEVFDLDETRDYFVKTGTYSSKFDFRNAHVVPSEVAELGSYLLYIQYQASEMAGPLTTPSIYGMSTTNEWCVREWIAPKTGTPTIYEGMPLRCEFRVFVDCDTDEVIGVSPYWRTDVMLDRLQNASDADAPKQVHDYVVFSTLRDKLEADYDANVDRVTAAVAEMLPDLDLEGQWSLDVMLNGDDLWAIDMALAQNSALVDVVPKNKLKPTKEDWIPRLGSPNSTDTSTDSTQDEKDLCPNPEMG